MERIWLKDLVLFFMTPHIKSEELGVQRQCWRQCGHRDANHSQLLPFGDRMPQIFEDMFHFKIPKDPRSEFLGLVNWRCVVVRGHVSLQYFIIACKKARNWLKCDPPSQDEWWDIRGKMEKLTNVRTQTRLWTKWLEFKKKVVYR